MIPFILISLAATGLIFVLRSQAALCNAKMDTVTNQYSSSIYKDKDKQWFDPKTSWTNKHFADVWKYLGKQYLPVLVYMVIKNIKPGYDPVSDFWHWEKTKMIMWDFATFIISCIATGFLFYLHFSALTTIPLCLMFLAWVAGWNGTFDDHLSKLRV